VTNPFSMGYSPWVEAMGWMLLHSLWQGAVVATTLALLMCLFNRASAQIRYVGACLAMVLLIAPPLSGIRRLPLNAERAAERMPTPEPARPELVRTLVAGSAKAFSVEQLRQLFPPIVGLWTAGASLLSLRLLGGWVLARR
jgi:bla regulator protein blaR1